MIMRGLKKRVISVRFASPSEAAEFLEHVSKLLGNLAAEVKGCSVKLVVMAPPEELDREYARVREALRQWRMSRQLPRRGVYRHHMSMVLSSASLKVSIPVAALVELLQLKGFRAKLEGGYIVSSATFEQVVEEASRLSEKYAEALRLLATPMLKRLAAILAAALGCTVEEALKRMEALGLTKVDEKYRRLVLAINYEEALKRIRGLVLEGVGGGGGRESGGGG
ncbi:MAG: hypothetical protein DRJ57_01480 [Thermoprotei archaeon]|nr:MAG: hypothetical protein DRJ57_01480 [Thermoprotei archaeon]